MNSMKFLLREKNLADVLFNCDAQGRKHRNIASCVTQATQSRVFKSSGFMHMCCCCFPRGMHMKSSRKGDIVVYNDYVFFWILIFR